MMQIQLLNRAEIDEKRWNNCIKNAPNGLIYGTTDYLDAIAQKWKGLVYGNYEIVMPIPYTRFLWFSLIQQPFFIQQLGAFGKSINEEVLELFINHLYKKFDYGCLILNYGNRFKDAGEKINLIVQLNVDYKTIQNKYSKDLQRNLHFAKRFEFKYKVSSDAVQSLKLFKKLYHHRFKNIKTIHFKREIEFLLSNPDKSIVRAIYLEDELQASLMALKDDRRIYLLFSATTLNGRKSKANHVLIDQFIREFAGQDYILDFEGSEIPSIAYFYKNFGAVPQPYFEIRWNNLPWWLRLVKK